MDSQEDSRPKVIRDATHALAQDPHRLSRIIGELQAKRMATDSKQVRESIDVLAEAARDYERKWSPGGESGDGG